MATMHPREMSGRRPRRRAVGGLATVVSGVSLLVWSSFVGPIAGTMAAAEGAAQKPDAVSLEQILERAGVYVLDFGTRFSNVVTEEHYVQESTEPSARRITTQSSQVRDMSTGSIPPRIARRELLSDFLLVKLPGLDDWLPYRDVFEVDKKPVRDREDRLSRLFLHPTASTLGQALRIMEESARYNIGNIQRTINLPVFALEALRSDDQRRFRFSKGKLDPAVGANVYIVEYKEHVPPALIQGPKGRDLFCRGRFWIDAPTGRVMKSELIVEDAEVHASVTTRYQVDQAYGLAVPVDMKEDYGLPNGAHVTGLATYANFRRFDVQVDDNVKLPDAR